jgi:Co/Zn/Cd efflux system component
VTSVAALINAGWLLILELLVAGAAADRLIAGTTRVDGLAVLAVSGAASLAMTVGAVILHGDADDDIPRSVNYKPPVPRGSGCPRPARRMPTEPWASLALHEVSLNRAN